MSDIYQYVPTRKISHYTTSGTTWQVIAVNNTSNVCTGYSTLAALRAAASSAGNEWPNLDPGMFLRYLVVRSENGSGGDGASFYIAFNKTLQPGDDDGELVSGAGQQFVFPGGFWNVWLRKITAGDEIILTGAY